MNYILLLLFSFLNGYQQSETVELIVIVTHITTLEGSIEMGLFKDSETLLKKIKSIKHVLKK